MIERHQAHNSLIVTLQPNLLKCDVEKEIEEEEF